MDRLAWAKGVGVVAVVAASAAGCQANAARHTVAGTERQAGGRSMSAARPRSAARVEITPRNGTTDARTGAGITVHALHGTLTRVVVRAGGRPVAGAFNAGRTVWRSRWTLRVATGYRVNATGIDRHGRTVAATAAFRTFRPASTFTTTIFEGRGQTYGVGMPIILTFSRRVTHRRAVERALELTTSQPTVGAWYWDGDQTLYFRPIRYWKPHTVVRFTGHLNGVEAAPGVYGVHTLTQTFSIGRSLITVADTQTHHVRVFLDRRLLGDWPMSSGRPGDDTPNGTYLTIEKGNPVEMKGPGYDLMVPWSVRFTWSGDYLHDAYWSVGEQGFTNVSHGCVNLSPANAETYYKLAVPGEPVTIAGSPRAGAWDNGWTVWFLSWRELLQGSALHQAVFAARGGSTFIDPRRVPPPGGRPPLGMPTPGNARAA